MKKTKRRLNTMRTWFVRKLNESAHRSHIINMAIKERRQKMHQLMGLRYDPMDFR